jgi:CBS domain-containing protein
MNIRDVMTARPRGAAPDTPLSQVAELMETEDIGAIPILDGDRLTTAVRHRSSHCSQSMALYCSRLHLAGNRRRGLDQDLAPPSRFMIYGTRPTWHALTLPFNL